MSMVTVWNAIELCYLQGIRDRWGLKKKDGATGEEKDMKIVPVIWSVVATSFSANFVLGFPAEMYYLGTEFGVLCIGLAIGFPTAIFLFVKKFYALGIPSVFDVRVHILSGGSCFVICFVSQHFRLSTIGRLIQIVTGRMGGWAGIIGDLVHIMHLIISKWWFFFCII